jgi:hypothetical protein
MSRALVICPFFSWIIKSTVYWRLFDRKVTCTSQESRFCSLGKGNITLVLNSWISDPYNASTAFLAALSISIFVFTEFIINYVVSKYKKILGFDSRTKKRYDLANETSMSMELLRLNISSRCQDIDLCFAIQNIFSACYLYLVEIV